MCKKISLAFFCLTVFSFIASGLCQEDAGDAKEKARQYYLRGNLYYQQGQYQEAQDEFKKALDLLNHKEEVSFVAEKETAKPLQEPVAVIPEEKIPAGSSMEYTIGTEDVLFISVWQNQDLDQEAIVRPDGRISFPLIGDIQVSGLTVTQLDHAVTQRLKEYIRSPEVSISIRKIGGQRVFVLGEVREPGVYSLTGSGKTLMEAITLAGGLSRDAIASSVIVIRGGFSDPKPIRVSLNKVFKGDMRNNLALQSEDIVFVPKKFIADLNYFLTQIIEPLSKGAYASRDYRYLQNGQ